MSAKIEVWAYCLMPNHVHLVAVPNKQTNLALAIGEAHRRYTRYINYRENWRGYLWQGRFASFPMDESYLYSTVRYVVRNPVKANLVSSPELWEWSSAKALTWGYEKVYYFAIGYPGWESAGHPIEKAK